MEQGILSLKGIHAQIKWSSAIMFEVFAIRAGDSVKKSCVCVTDVVDIEENIWSPRYI